MTLYTHVYAFNIHVIYNGTHNHIMIHQQDKILYIIIIRKQNVRRKGGRKQSCFENGYNISSKEISNTLPSHFIPLHRTFKENIISK